VKRIKLREILLENKFTGQEHKNLYISKMFEYHGKKDKDFNNDGVVNILDLATVGINYGMGC
jgi:hypothetical protein